MDIIGRRSEKNFKSFVWALVDQDEDELAKELDKDLAEQFIHHRNFERDDDTGFDSC